MNMNLSDLLEEIREIELYRDSSLEWNDEFDEELSDYECITKENDRSK